MRPEIQYAVVSRDLGIAEIRFQVRIDCKRLLHPDIARSPRAV